MLKSLSYTHPRWRQFHRTPAFKISSVWLPWLAERGSLTRRLQQLAGGDFDVIVLGECWEVPTYTEAQALGLKRKQRAYIREVELCGKGECWVKARTVIPATSLRGALLPLRHLGKQPLGHHLFADPKISRGPIEVALVSLGDHERVCARRSLFSLGAQSLLVSEAFMPALELQIG